MAQMYARQQPRTLNEKIVNNDTHKLFQYNSSHNTGIVIQNRSKVISKQHVVGGNVSSKTNPVSGTIRQAGSWETYLLDMTRELYAAEPGLQLLDLSCHVGVFTLTAALLGHTTVAVDGNSKNLRRYRHQI